MSVPYTLYDDDGKIIRTGVAMDTVQALGQAQGGGTVVLTASDQSAQYVDTGSGTVTSRGAMSVSGTPTEADKVTIDADGVEVLTISPVPNGATVYISAPPVAGIENIPPTVVTDGEVEITTTVAGLYKVRIAFGNFADYNEGFNAI